MVLLGDLQGNGMRDIKINIKIANKYNMIHKIK
jgi:hypothetical protein